MLNTLQALNDEAWAEIREEMAVRKTSEVFVLFPMGSQFDHLIKQGMENLGVFCLVADPNSVTVSDLRRLNPVGIILSGGPASVHSEPPKFDYEIFNLGIPVLGICLGFQMIAKHIGCIVEPASKREFGTHRLSLKCGSALFQNCPPQFNVVESHGDKILPSSDLTVLGSTDNAEVAAGQSKHLWGVQFHPEVTHTEHGLQIFENFCVHICGACDRFPAEDIAGRKIEELGRKIGHKKVAIAISAGSDSSTVAYLLKEALGPRAKNQLFGVYLVGSDRPDDKQYALEYFGNLPWLDFRVVDVTARLLSAVAGITSMGGKRDAMADGVYGPALNEFVRDVQADFIVQGTLYTDLSESGLGYASGARKARIKRHHNTHLKFLVPELMPLGDCVKDSGRNIGRAIGVPEELLRRHPFPGPGMLLRIEGEVNEETLRSAKACDGIWIDEMRQWELYNSVWQAGAVRTLSETTCTKGDDAAIGQAIALWAVWSVNGFTAEAAELPWDFLKYVDRRILNEVKDAGVCVYKLSGKPPTTIEWG
ncbi:MAG: gamma-glutamyl-gamma-aminobutyrate hydrolase family protein [Candidatus Doudnabacteria bacterium]|nr:gamma-glutamyl-gamma-aminobutyrate hydrolase family protein [Candidatus Doudnabacteria bacterium]